MEPYSSQPQTDHNPPHMDGHGEIGRNPQSTTPNLGYVARHDRVSERLPQEGHYRTADDVPGERIRNRVRDAEQAAPDDALSDRDASASASPHGVSWSAEDCSRHNQRTRRVLVVDDEPEVLSSVQSILQPEGFELVCLSSLGAAVEALSEQTFDLVLTDLYLGDEELGYRLAELAQKARHPIPVILLTGRPSFPTAQEALRSKVEEILVKPVEPHMLVGTCRRTIDEVTLRHRAQRLEEQNRILSLVLPRTVEAKDPTTSGHAERVVRYTDVFASKLGVGEDERAALRMASLLHDVGKIGVPDAVLTKPGPLTVEERALIERHPQAGYDILAGIDGDERVRNWVYQHHEKWDGTGYPNQLTGEEVALPGRILILAEVYDALSTKRSYKDPWSDDKIASFFESQAGKHFDPDLARMAAEGLRHQGRRFFMSTGDTLF